MSECWRFNAMSATRAIFMAKGGGGGGGKVKGQLSQ